MRKNVFASRPAQLHSRSAATPRMAELRGMSPNRLRHYWQQHCGNTKASTGQMFKATQESPGDFTAQGLQKTEGRCTASGLQLGCARWQHLNCSPSLRTPLFPLQENLGLKVIREGCYESTRPWSGWVGRYNKSAQTRGDLQGATVLQSMLSQLSSCHWSIPTLG